MKKKIRIIETGRMDYPWMLEITEYENVIDGSCHVAQLHFKTREQAELVRLSLLVTSKEEVHEPRN